MNTLENEIEIKHRKILDSNPEEDLFAAFLACKSRDEIKAFLEDLCTPQELNNLSERWVLARLLSTGGLSYRDISTVTGASTTTVGRVARFLQQEPHKGYQLVLERTNNAK